MRLDQSKSFWEMIKESNHMIEAIIKTKSSDGSYIVLAKVHGVLPFAVWRVFEVDGEISCHNGSYTHSIDNALKEFKKRN